MAMHRVKEGQPAPGAQRHETAVTSAAAEYPLGVGRPPLNLADLPTPEEARWDSRRRRPTPPNGALRSCGQGERAF